MISRDVAIVLTVAVVNLAVGPRTFRPVDLRKDRDGDVRLHRGRRALLQLLGRPSAFVTAFVYASLVITFVSAGHYLTQVVNKLGTEFIHAFALRSPLVCV